MLIDSVSKQFGKGKGLFSVLHCLKCLKQLGVSQMAEAGIAGSGDPLPRQLLHSHVWHLAGMIEGSLNWDY